MGKREKHRNHIVLADDDADQGILFRHILNKVDAAQQLTTINDGDELMKFLSEKTPDLLFLDLNMPCKNGLECLHEIRQNPVLKDLPIIVYSSSSQMTDIQRSYLHQADLYMVKPFNASHLKNALESILDMEWRKNYTTEKYYFINNRFVPFTS